MTDRHLLDLSPKWAIGFDSQQWILMKRRNMRTQSGWKPVSFIPSTKTVLLRILREKDITPTQEAMMKIDAMPERFLDWKAQHDLDGHRNDCLPQ